MAIKQEIRCAIPAFGRNESTRGIEPLGQLKILGGNVRLEARDAQWPVRPPWRPP